MRQNNFVNFILYSGFLLLFFTLVSFSTSNRQDSLSNKSSKELYRLYRVYKNINPEKAVVYADELYKISLLRNDNRELAKALYNKAYVEKNLGNTEEALAYIDTSLTISRTLKNDSLLLKNTNLQGIIWSNKGDYEKALEHYHEAKTIAERLGNLNDILVMSRNIGIIRMKISDYPGAVEVFTDNLKKIKASKIKNFEREHALNLYNLSDIHLKIGDYNQAEIFIDSAFTFTSRKTLSDLYVPFYSIKAIINFQQQKYKASIDICKELVSEIKTANNNKKLLTPYLYLGKSYFKLKEYDTSIIFFEKIKSIVSVHDITFPDLGETYSHLVDCYIIKKNPEKAKANLDLLNEFNENRQETNTDVNHQIYKELETKLGGKLEILNVENEKQKKKVTYLSALAVLLAVLFLIIYLKKQSLNNQRFKKLLQTIEGLEESQKESIVVNKKASKEVAPENVEHILKALDKFEKNELFLNTQCNLVYVAKKLKTNTSYLSKVVNTHKGKTFKSYLTELRINASLIHLKNNKQLRLYTIKALAEEFGFKRYETFSRAFKAQTGIYPSVYIKNLQKGKI